MFIVGIVINEYVLNDRFYCLSNLPLS